MVGAGEGVRRPGRRPLIDPTATPQTLASQDRIGPRMMRNAHKRAVAAGGHAVLFQRVGGAGAVVWTQRSGRSR